MKNLKEQLMEQAREKGICVDGYSEMRAGNVDGLVLYYIQNPDWCLERDFPDLKSLKENFSDIEDRGIYVGKHFRGEILNELQTYIFHKCTGTVKVGMNVDKAIIPMLYVANGCKLHFVGIGDFAPKDKDNRPKVPIYTFGKNDVSAKDNKWVKFIHYKHDML